MRSKLPTCHKCVGMMLLTLAWIGCESIPPDGGNGNHPPNTNNRNDNRDPCRGREASGDCHVCESDAECADGKYCNGREACVDGACAAGERPCAASSCDEEDDSCAMCQSDAECDDGIACTDDACVEGVCRSAENDENCSAEQPYCIGVASERSPRVRQTGCQDPCRSQCELCAADCQGDQGGDLPDYDSRREALLVASSAASCSDLLPYIAAGECDDGKPFLLSRSDSVVEADVYDADSGAPLGRHTRSDCVDAICGGRGHWPEPIECRNPRITEVLCGRLHDIGDAVELP